MNGEKNPRMAQPADVSDALELERIEFSRSMRDAAAEARAEVEAFERELAARGLAGSGRRYVREMEIRFAKMADGVIEKAITKRKELGRRVPDLFTTPHLNQLRDKLHHHVDAVVNAQKNRTATGGMHVAGAASLTQQTEMKAYGIKARIAQDLEALRLEARLGMHAEEKPVTIFNISDSTIASLNLGTVIGDLTASVQVLNDQGQKEFAAVVQALTEALAKSESLQDVQRKELLEHLSLVATETAMPPEKRSMGLLKSSVAVLRKGVENAAQLAHLWSAIEQVLKAMKISFP
jgi:hypothetical protein